MYENIFKVSPAFVKICFFLEIRFSMKNVFEVGSLALKMQFYSQFCLFLQ